MLTRIIKLISISALLGIGVLWHYAVNDSLLFNSVILCSTVCFAAYHAIRAERYLWAWGLLGLALLFNPLVSFYQTTGKLFCASGATFCSAFCDVFDGVQSATASFGPIRHTWKFRAVQSL